MGSQARKHDFRGHPKKRPKWFRNQLPAATWLQARLGGPWGSMMVHSGVHFELPNRSNTDTENKLVLKCFWAPQEISESGSGRVIMTPFAPRWGLNGGGNLSHRINVSMYQGFKDSWYQSINITRTLGDNRLRFYAFHRFYQRPLLSLVTPTRGVGGFESFWSFLLPLSSRPASCSSLLPHSSLLAQLVFTTCILHDLPTWLHYSEYLQHCYTRLTLFRHLPLQRWIFP